PALEYQVTLDDAKYKHGESIPRKVRVFNIDYVARNVGIVAEGASPIYVLGEQSQEILAAIKKDEIALNGVAGDESKPGLVELRRRATEAQRQVTRERDRAFTDIARTISAARGSGAALRTYNAANAKRRFAEIKQKAILGESELKSCRLTIEQPPETELKLLT